VAGFGLADEVGERQQAMAAEATTVAAVVEPSHRVLDLAQPQPGIAHGDGDGFDITFVGVKHGVEVNRELGDEAHLITPAILKCLAQLKALEWCQDDTRFGHAASG
jgi:hypothetical protein